MQGGVGIVAFVLDGLSVKVPLSLRLARQVRNDNRGVDKFRGKRGKTGEGARLHNWVCYIALLALVTYFDWSTVMPCGLLAAFSALAFLAAMALSTHSSAAFRSAAR